MRARSRCTLSSAARGSAAGAYAGTMCSSCCRQGPRPSAVIATVSRQHESAMPRRLAQHARTSRLTSGRIKKELGLPPAREAIACSRAGIGAMSVRRVASLVASSAIAAAARLSPSSRSCCAFGGSAAGGAPAS